MGRRNHLTQKGKRALVIALTVSGCAFGVLAAVLISLVCMGKEADSYVLACERGSVANCEESEKYSRFEQCSNLVEPQWLFYQSRADNGYVGEEKVYIDQQINRWTKGQLTDDELSEQLGNYFVKKNVSAASVEVQSKMLCLFPSANDLPDYTQMLEKDKGQYHFIGIYTDGEWDEQGRLICYYWEVEVLPKEIQCRFISSKYFEDRDHNLISEEKGGLPPDSRWAQDPMLRQILRNALSDGENVRYES